MGSHSLFQGIFPTQGLNPGHWASLIAQLVKNPPAMWETWPGLGRSPGKGKGYPLQCSGLKNSMDCTVLIEFCQENALVIPNTSAFPLGWPWEAQSSPRVARESWGLRSSHCRAEATSPRRVSALSLFTFMHRRRKWQPTPVFLPGESQKTGEPGGLPSTGSHRAGQTAAGGVVPA